MLAHIELIFREELLLCVHEKKLCSSLEAQIFQNKNFYFYAVHLRIFVLSLRCISTIVWMCVRLTGFFGKHSKHTTHGNREGRIMKWRGTQWVHIYVIIINTVKWIISTTKILSFHVNFMLAFAYNNKRRKTYIWVKCGTDWLSQLFHFFFFAGMFCWIDKCKAIFRLLSNT